jgi:hypothetical protein
MLFWNEGRAVSRYKALKEGRGIVVSVPSNRVDSTNEGKLVHLTGQATTTDILQDETFGVTVNAVHLDRQVEMYQWRENSDSKTEKKVGGSTETTTTYSYSKAWSNQEVDSSRFKEPEGHQNPGPFPYGSRKMSAQEVRLGGFQLSPGLTASMSRSEPLAVEKTSGLSGELRWRARLHDGGYYLGRSPGSPEVGDMRIRFRYVQPQMISVVARQASNGLQPYETSNGETVQLLRYGAVSPEAMFASAQRGNRIVTWLLRFLGFFLMFWGLKAVVKPLSVLADVLPLLGNLVASGTGAIAFLGALALSSLTVAVAWLYYRPGIALILVLLAVAAVWAIKAKVSKARRSGAIPPPAPAFPPS